MNHQLVPNTGAGPHPWDIDLPDDLMTALMFVDDECARADVAVINGHRDFRSNLDARADRGIELYRAGVVELFVCSGSEKVEGGNRRIGASSATYLAKRLIADGVPKPNVHVYRQDDVFPLRGMQEFVKRGRIKPVETILVVSSPWRSRRDQLFALYAADNGQRVFVCSAIEQCNAATWTHHERSRHYIRLWYHKLVNYDLQVARSCQWPEAIIDDYQRRHGLTRNECGKEQA